MLPLQAVWVQSLVKVLKIQHATSCSQKWKKNFKSSVIKINTILVQYLNTQNLMQKKIVKKRPEAVGMFSCFLFSTLLIGGKEQRLFNWIRERPQLLEWPNKGELNFPVIKKMLERNKGHRWCQPCSRAYHDSSLLVSIWFWGVGW